MRIGVDYYPEHWDRKLWEDDARLMQKTGVKIVRLAEFAWGIMEPSEGTFDFSMFDEAIDLFEKYGIEVVLCTPTNCPPLWLYEKYPSAVRISPDGGHIATGIRGHRCYNDPEFVRLSSRIVEEMTKHFSGRKSVLAWQIDNELESNICACDVCMDRYRSWLKNKYSSLDEMNERYGDVVWSGNFSDWSQIKAPTDKYNHAWLNPAYMLDYYRFASDDMIEYVKRQADIIRKNCPDVTITTNSWFCEAMPDLHKTFEGLDFVSYDNYPPLNIPQNSEEYYSHSFHLDFMRGVKNENFWIMEQLSGGMGCWMPMGHTSYPGMIKGYSLQAIAHGADTILHFRWRTACKGAEMHWHGLIDHSNVPGRRFNEFAELCGDAEKLSEITDSRINSKVAVIYSYDSDLALKLQPQTEGFYYYNQLKAYHDAFSSHGVNVDIISDTDDVSKYDIVCAPSLYVCSEEMKQRLREYVAQGGTLILTCRSMVKDKDNACVMSQMPTGFTDVSGCAVAEYDPMGYDRVNVKDVSGESWQSTSWSDIIECDSAKPLLTYDGNYYKNSAAAAVNDFGKGRCYYIGTVLFKMYLRKFAADVLAEKGIEFFKDIPERVEITSRENGSKRWYFCFNNSKEDVSFDFKGKNMNMKAFEMKIIDEEMQNVL